MQKLRVIDEICSETFNEVGARLIEREVERERERKRQRERGENKLDIFSTLLEY